MDILKKLAEEFPSVRADRAQNIVNLIDDGNTIPFIARYRKEMTGGIDDQLLASSTTASSTCATSKSARRKSPPRSKSRAR